MNEIKKRYSELQSRYLRDLLYLHRNRLLVWNRRTEYDYEDSHDIYTARYNGFEYVFKTGVGYNFLSVDVKFNGNSFELYSWRLPFIKRAIRYRYRRNERLKELEGINYVMSNVEVNQTGTTENLVVMENKVEEEFYKLNEFIKDKFEKMSEEIISNLTTSKMRAEVDRLVEEKLNKIKESL